MNTIDAIQIEKTIELSKKCPKSKTAYSVGAILVTAEGKIFSGYSRKTDPKNHAEEEVILKALKDGSKIENATLYSSMEPCSKRKSKNKSCLELIIENKIKKVVFAASEPKDFVDCEGEKVLKNAGVKVTKFEKLEKKALDVNRHILL